MGPFDQIGIPIQINIPQSDTAVLPQAENLSFVTEPSTLLGQLEAIGCALKRLKTIERGRFLAARTLALRADIAHAGIAATTYAPPQLMQCGEAESLAVFDEHDGGVGHIHADLDDGRRDQYIDIPLPELLDDTVFIASAHLAVQHLDTMANEELSQARRLRIDGMKRQLGPSLLLFPAGKGNVLELVLIIAFRHQGADDIGLVPGLESRSNRTIGNVSVRTLYHLSLIHI